MASSVPPSLEKPSVDCRFFMPRKKWIVPSSPRPASSEFIFLIARLMNRMVIGKGCGGRGAEGLSSVRSGVLRLIKAAVVYSRSASTSGGLRPAFISPSRQKLWKVIP